ncbi:MAG: DUF5103 domain-containing protein [Bacteroidales bacterium]|jgi:hypothetical protein|nr:DUF5103 domain-containing protein [Bacteroidales bacterium]
MKKICGFIVIILLWSGWSTRLTGQDYAHILFSDQEYAGGLSGIKFSVAERPFTRPIITLNSDEQLVLEFDDLEEESRYLKYKLIHCTYNWQPSSLLPIEYLTGFMEDEITDVSSSFANSVFYMHYRLALPNGMIQLTKSGNYLLFVYDDTEDNPILTRRLMVKEPVSVSITGAVHQATDVSNMQKQQEVDFVVRTGSYVVNNPAAYLHATILQNGRWDNAIQGLIYRYGKPGEYSFDYDDGKNCFNGGSEFRTFDIRSLRYNSNRIVSISFQNRVYHAFIVEDIARPFGAYESNSTLRGSCYFKNEDFDGENREEYAATHFALHADFPIRDGDVYVFGELTNWRISEEAKLTYNESSNYYETKLFLKQGYYNYQYVYVKSGSSRIDETYIEGSHWQTDNEYTVLIYLQEEGSSYDKLVGVTYFSIAN